MRHPAPVLAPLVPVVLGILIATPAGAQCVPLTSAPYSQNFDTLANTGTTNSLTITGWFLTESGGGARDNEQYGADTGGSTTGDTYSYGASGSSERALGSLQSGTLIPIYGACFTNTGGVPIPALAISYSGEEWRCGTAGRADRIDFQYSTDATSLTTGTWTDYDPLDFSTLDFSTTGAKDGNVLRATVGAALAVAVAPGATIWIRWVDSNATAADDGLAVDDFTLVDATAPVELLRVTVK